MEAPMITTTGLQRIHQISIRTKDTARAVAFYRDALGLKLLFQMPTMGFFDCGGVRLMVSTSEKPGETYSSILYFKVADIQEAWRELMARGVTTEREPHLIAKLPDHDLWMAFFRDPDRNVMALMSEVRNG